MVDLSKRRWFTPNRQPNQSQVRLPWLARPDAFTDECTRCGKCVTACETHIIEKGDGGFPTVNFSIDECTFCYQCAQSCPGTPLRGAKRSAMASKGAHYPSLFGSTASGVPLLPRCLPRRGDSFCFANRPHRKPAGQQRTVLRLRSLRFGLSQ